MKYNYDLCKLRGRIVEKYGSCSNLAKSLHTMKFATLMNKINGKTFFKQDEIEELATLLCISKYEIMEYFFTLKK